MKAAAKNLIQFLVIGAVLGASLIFIAHHARNGSGEQRFCNECGSAVVFVPDQYGGLYDCHKCNVMRRKQETKTTPGPVDRPAE